MESSTSTHPASDATQETAVETRKHWTVESAIQWGGRNGLDGQRLTELHEFASLIKTVEISSSDLKGAVTLDSGSFGTIEKSSLNGTTVAVKRFIKDANSSKSVAQVLRDAYLELSMLCSTKHPNIVEFLGVPAYFPKESDSDQSNSFGFVFEFCSNGSLFSVIHEKRTKLGFDEKIRLMKELATSLVYLHGEEIIHRDISSRNILLTANLTLKLADFGCARKISGGSYQPTTISGNPPWMAPEQLGGLVLSFSADVWSFGVVCWELFTETLPWSEVSNDLWSMRQLVFEEGNHLPIPLTSSAPASIIEEVRAITMIMKLAFQRNPAARPQMPWILSSLEAIEQRSTRAWIEGLVLNQRVQLEARLAQLFGSLPPPNQMMPQSEEIALLAKLHAEELDDKLLNIYLKAKYKADISNIRAAIPAQGEAARKLRGGSGTGCRGCPHVYGDPVNGYHEIMVPGDSRYLGDMIGGYFNGLGILTLKDGTKLQGEFRNSQLVRPFSVENMRVSSRSQEMERSLSDSDRINTETQAGISEACEREAPAAEARPENDVSVAMSIDPNPSNAQAYLKDSDKVTLKDSDSANNFEAQARDSDEEQRRKRGDRLEGLLARLAQTRKLVDGDSVSSIANRHRDDADDGPVDAYLMQTYQTDLAGLGKLSAAGSLAAAPTAAVAKKGKSKTYTCRLCPHNYGQLLSGHHEVHLPDGSRYLGDMTNGLLDGLGILRRIDGSKVQGQFQANQLILPFSVEDIRSTLPHGALELEASTGTESNDSETNSEARRPEPAANLAEMVHMEPGLAGGGDATGASGRTGVGEKVSPPARRSESSTLGQPETGTSAAAHPGPGQAAASSRGGAAEDRPARGLIEHPVFELASDSAATTREHFEGGPAKQPPPSGGSHGPMRPAAPGLLGLRPGGYGGPSHAAGTLGLGGSPGPQLYGGGVLLSNAVSGGTPGPQRPAIDPSRTGGVDVHPNGALGGNAMVFGSYGEGPHGGTPGPQAPVANLFRTSTPGTGPAIRQAYEHPSRGDQPSGYYGVPPAGHYGPAAGQYEQLGRYESPGRATAYGAGPDVQAVYAASGFYGAPSMYSYAAAQQLAAPQGHGMGEQAFGGGDKSYPQEHGGPPGTGNYYRPPLLESQANSRQNVMQISTPNGYMGAPGYLVTDKRRLGMTDSSGPGSAYGQQAPPADYGPYGQQAPPAVAGMSPYYSSYGQGLGAMLRR